MDYNISTITMSMQIPNCCLNLMNVGKYLDIDVDIIGVKYNFGKSSILKGRYSTAIYKKSKVKNKDKINKQLFYNQVSIIVRFQHNTIERMVNVKLFGNGSLHLTGIKNPDEGKVVMHILYSKLLQLVHKFDNILLTLDTNNVYIDNDNNIYSFQEHTIIGYKYISDNKVLYNIRKKDYDIDCTTGFFISKTFESKRTKTILNFDGIPIGYSKLELLKNKSKLYKNNSNVNFDFAKGFIYYDGDGKSTIIGRIIYSYTKSEIPSVNIIEHNYSCNPFLPDSKIVTIDKIDSSTLQELQYDINCINTYFKLDFELNRQRLFKEFIQRLYICEYKPEKYSGVKLRYKVSNIYPSMGRCSCTSKCTCKTITFLIFQSGNVIVTGFKSVIEIPLITNEFIDIIKELEPRIKKKVLAVV